MRPYKTSLITLALALPAVLAGCASVDPLAPGEADDVLVTPAMAAIRDLLSDVPCELSGPVDHVATSDNLLPLGTFSSEVKDRIDMDAHGGMVAQLSRLGLVLDLVDVTDPQAPTLIETYPIADLDDALAMPLDTKFFANGTGLLVSDIGARVAVLDTRDPANIAVESIAQFAQPYPGTSEGHMLATANIDEVDWVWMATSSGQGLAVFRIDGAPGMRTIEHVTTYHPTVTEGTSPLSGGPAGPHDPWVTFDEKLNTTLLYIANAFEGWQVYDVANPLAPILLADVPNTDPYQGFIHTIRAVHLEDGRRIVVTISEVGANVMRIYDATNVGDPEPTTITNEMAPARLIGTWARDASDLAAPQHNINVVGTLLFVAHDAHGVYVFDLADTPATPNFHGGGTPILTLDAIQPIAHLAGKGPEPRDYALRGDVWDVLVHDGIIYTSHTGPGLLKATAFGCLAPGEPALTSTG